MATGLPKAKWKGNGAPSSTGVTGHKSKTAMDLFLSYQDKKSEIEILETTPTKNAVLWCGGQGVKNRLYYGDNLPILSSLLHDSSICGNVQLIYIDPPFSTKSIFKSRSQVDAYCDLLSGATYIEFIRQRLVILRELLSNNGSIYVHLDGNMVFHIKIIMDEIFGPNNFRSFITRKKCNSKNYTRKMYGNISDYILFYTKSNKYVWNRPFEEWTVERAKKEYPCIDPQTGRSYKKVPIHAPGKRNGKTGDPWRGMLPPPGKHWQYTPEKLDKMDIKGEIYWSPNGNPRRKIYLDNSKGVPVQDIWLEFLDAHNQNIKITGYPTEKNQDLLARIIKASSNPGDIVLDCFSGSGSSLAVASQLKRRWIGIDNSPEAIAATFQQFSNGMARMGDFVTKTKSPKQTKLISRGSEFITDFTFNVSESYMGELDNLLNEWKTNLANF